MAFTQITVTGTYLVPSGSGSNVPATGSVSFTLSTRLQDSTDLQIVYPPQTLTAQLNSSGQISIRLIANNDPTTQPQGSVWNVTENVNRQVTTYAVSIPYNAAGGTVDLSTLAPTTSTLTYSYVLQSSVGAPGGVAELDSSGLVPTAELGTGTASGSTFLRGDQTWAAATASANATEIQSVAVSAAAPTNGQVLGYSSTAAEWEPTTPATAAVSSVFGRTGAVVATTGDYAVAQVTGAAPLASPALTGSPTAPTQTALSDNTDIATTAYTDAAVAVETARAEAAETTKLTNPMTTVGDLIIGGTAGAPGRLAAGTATYVLTSGGAGVAPSWAAATGGGGGGYSTAPDTGSGGGGSSYVDSSATSVSYATPPSAGNGVVTVTYTPRSLAYAMLV